MLDKSKALADSLEIKIAYGICRLGRGFEHIINFNCEKEIIGSSYMLLPDNGKNNFNEEEHFNSVKNRFIEELNSIGYRLDNSQSDNYLIKAKKG